MWSIHCTELPAEQGLNIWVDVPADEVGKPVLDRPG